MVRAKQGRNMRHLIVIPLTFVALGHVAFAFGFDLWISLSVKEIDYYVLEFHTIHC